MADPHLVQICRELIKGGTLEEQIDVGVYYTDRTGKRPKKKIYPETKGDGDFQPQECYAQAIREAEKDMMAYGQLLLLYKRRPIQKNWNELVKFKERIDGQGELGKFKRDIPFLYTDFDPSTKDDDEIFAKVLEKIHRGRGSRTTVNFVRRLGALLTNPKTKGGFEVVPTPFSTPEEPTVNDHEQTAIQSITSGFADCSEFAFAYYGLYTMMRPALEPLIIRAPWDGKYNHVRIGIKQADQRSEDVIIVDPADKDNPVRPLHEDEVEITPLQLMAIYFKSLAHDQLKGASKDEQFEYSKDMIETALRYDLYDSQIYRHLGNLYRDAGLFDLAMIKYQTASYLERAAHR